jgi:hypothetical protein
MCLDLNRFDGFANYTAQCRKMHKGNAVRDALRAVNRGYEAKFFRYENFLDDVDQIAISKPIRQGQPLSDDYTRQHELLSYPATLEPERVPTNSLTWLRMFGVFLKKPGHCQGPHQVDEQCIAYARVRRYGHCLFVNRFIGHSDHFKHGIMHLMHMDLVKALYEVPDVSLRGIRYLISGGYISLLPEGQFGKMAGDGLLKWKLRLLYRPGYLIYRPEDYRVWSAAYDWARGLVQA